MTCFSAGPSAKEIAICECDRNLIVNLQSSTPSSSLPNFPANNCTKATVIHQTECCMLPNGLYEIFNPTVHCCNATGIHQIGSCWCIIYNHFILLSHEKFLRCNLFSCVVHKLSIQNFSWFTPNFLTWRFSSVLHSFPFKLFFDLVAVKTV